MGEKEEVESSWTELQDFASLSSPHQNEEKVRRSCILKVLGISPGNLPGFYQVIYEVFYQIFYQVIYKAIYQVFYHVIYHVIYQVFYLVIYQVFYQAAPCHVTILANDIFAS